MEVHDIFFMTTISGLHNGSGTGEGFIDNPIIRERHTFFPFVQATSLKGAFREASGKDDDVHVKILFGPPPGRGDSHGGAVSFSDAALFAFPIRSLKGHFVWATTPHLLYRMSLRLRVAGKSLPELDTLFAVPGQNLENLQHCPDGSGILCINDRIVLEEFAVPSRPSDALQKFAQKIAGIIFANAADGFLKAEFGKKLIIMEENLFRHFVRYATEIQPNISIDETGTTSTGSLRYTEYLPSESILYFAAKYKRALEPEGGYPSHDLTKYTLDGIDIDLTDSRCGPENIRTLFDGHRPGEVLQIGGDETTGKGIVSLQKSVF